MNKKRKAIIASNEISEIRTYLLGGYPQKVLIEGKKKSNLIVIFLHGGPGSPIPFCVGCRGMFPELTERATMVYWDQLGCGINNHVTIDESFSIEHFVTMTIDLITQIKADFPHVFVNIFAVSWGSILAVKAINKVPELIHKAVIYGQVLKQLSFNDEVFDTLEKSTISNKHRAMLASIKQSTSHSLKDLKTIMRFIGKYTEGYQAKSGGKMPLLPILWGILTSPDYRLKDFKAIAINACTKNKSLLTELLSIDLSDDLKNIRVPYMIFQGERDIVTSTKMLSQFVQSAKNDKLIFNIVENSAHMPSALGMDAITQIGFSFLQG